MIKISFLNFLDKKEKEQGSSVLLEFDLPKLATNLRLKELMIEHAIDLISKTIAKSEVEVFRNKNGKVNKSIDDVYYTLNVRPNPNQDGTAFMYSLVSKLLRDNEALVVRMSNSDLFLADRWKKSDDIINGKYFSDVVISDGDLNEITLNKIINADDAVYMTLGESKIKSVLEEYYVDYAEMLKASVTSFNRSNFIKFKLGLPLSGQPLRNAKTGEEINLDDYVSKITGDLLKNKDTVVPLSQQFVLEQISNEKARSSDDTRNMIKDFGDKVAMAFNIPLDVYYGSKTDKSTATNDFITFAVLPILNIVEDAFNGKLISKEKYLKGERIKFDKFTMKHFDITDVAGSLDKLFAIGWSHNNLREIIGQPLIDEEWAHRHHVTKNYMDVNDPNGKEVSK